jgi:predicted RNA polymerase sigma factor
VQPGAVAGGVQAAHRGLTYRATSSQGASSTTLADRLEPRLAGYHPYHATRADLLRRLGRSHKARAAYDKAIDLAGNTAETAYLTRRRDQLG